MKFSGIMTALVTPFTTTGEVDEKELRSLVDFQISAGVRSLLALGGTGEYTAMSQAERVRVVRLVIDQAAGRVPTVVGVLAPGLGDALEMSLAAKAEGADAIMVVAPFYVSPTHEGFVNYYTELDQAVDMPIFLYNIPYKTGVNMAPSTVEAIVDALPNVIGIKECSPDLGQFLDMQRRVGHKITVLSGEEYLAPSEMILGAHGAVMASANLVPEVWVKIYDHIQAGEVAEAVVIAKQYFPVFQKLFVEGNPGPLKAAMGMVGHPMGPVLTPLKDASSQTREQLRLVLEQVGYTIDETVLERV